MTNDEARMSKECRITNAEVTGVVSDIRHSIIRHSFVIKSFGIRHLPPPIELKQAL
jgi:formate-dependent nitrite reductase cytochrome c552 subunit